MSVRNREAVESENKTFFICRNTDKICIFTDTGNMHLLKVQDLPFGRLRDKGTPIDNLSNYDSRQENVIGLYSLSALADRKVLFGTKQTMLKLVDGTEFDVAKRTTAATKLSEEDKLLIVYPLTGGETIVMRSGRDMFLRIEADSIPVKKKGAVGVRGMKLAPNDALTDIYMLPEGNEQSVEVKGKEVALHRLHVGNRDTKGVKK